MRIVKISANFPPRRCGIGDYTRLLCENLVKINKDISFYIITSAAAEIAECQYSYERIELIPLINNWSFAAIPKIINKITEISPDIIHIEFNRSLYGRSIAMNFLTYFLKRENQPYKIMITSHDLPGPLKNKDPFFWLTTLVMLIYCDTIIVSNDIDFNSFTARLPFIKRKCVLVPVGSNITKIESNRAIIRQELNISEGMLVLSFFGFIREDKCLAELLYAFSNLLRAGRNVKLLIAGGIANREIFSSLQKLGHNLNIEDMIIWMDYQSEKRISELLLASDIVVLPYKNGIGTNSGVFAAAALHSLPVLTTYAKFIPEVIKENYNLILVKPTVGELTNALLKLTEDARLREKLSGNLTELTTYLSWQRISREIFKLYTQLLGRC